MDNNKMPKNAKKYYCELCDFKCSKLSNYNIHIETYKHKNHENDNKMVKNDNVLSIKNAKYECFCGKKYNHQSGLSRHKKKCQKNNEQIVVYQEKDDEPSDKELIMMLIKDNSELRSMMMKVIENGTNNTTNNNMITNTNSNNKAFNLNFFLNETCKNAMNITDFVDSIKLQLSDLIEMGDIGYVEGISKIIMKNLNALDETERPIHCADEKRETIYIKDEDKWEKEGHERKKIKNTIKKIANKNIRLLPQFKEKYPDYNDADSIHSDQYSKIVIEAMGGNEGNPQDKEDKIIRNISRATTITKYT